VSWSVPGTPWQGSWRSLERENVVKVKDGRILAGGPVVLLAVALTGLLPPGAASQELQGTLSLEEAVELARRNNPDFLITENDEATADWNVLEAYGSFLPSFNTSLQAQYLAPGVPSTGIYTGEDFGIGSTDYYFSGYNLSLQYSLSGSTLFELASARASRRATNAGVRAAEYNLESAVTAQYLMALRARDGVQVAITQLQRAQETLELAQARVDVGAAPPTEGGQAEVELGRAQVALLEAESLLRTEKLRLAEQIGVPVEGDYRLISEFSLFEPHWDREDLVSRALEGHPQLRAFRAQESARNADARQAWSGYFPTLFAQATWSGRAREIGDQEYLVGQARNSVESQRSNCEFMNEIVAGLTQPVTGYPRDCSTYQLTGAQEAAILAGNDVFPFDFRKEPWSLFLQVSSPVFQGFSRERQIAEARAAAEDARFNRRAEELRVRTAVTGAFDELETAAQVVRIEERNREVAGEQLQLARERYSLGAAPILELLEAEESMATAERDYLDAQYRFHGAIWALEAAVGERIRQEAGEGTTPAGG
jgi:outer membrane protein